MRVAIFGGGSYGTAMAVAAARNGHDVCMLVRDASVAHSIRQDHVNTKYLPGLALPPSIGATCDVAEALRDTQFIFHCIPCQATLAFLEQTKHLIPDTIPIISTSKGIHTETLQLMSDLIPKGLGRDDQPLAYLSGPSFAKEIVANMPTAVVVASKEDSLALRVQNLLSNRVFRVYTTDDVIGVEVGGALKNPLAIAAGVAIGLGFGQNALAIIVTRGCSEIRKLAIAMGGRPETVSGLSGVGDLMLTAFGSLSRNKSVGVRLGQGESLESIMNSMTEVAEGIPTATACAELAKQYGLNLPIFQTVCDVLQGRMTCVEAVTHLMTLPLTAED